MGFMGVYILDALRFKEGAFAAAWLTVALANFGNVVNMVFVGGESTLPLSLLVFFLSSATLFLTGAGPSHACAYSAAAAANL
jgi:hypothetical protein